MLYGVIVFYVLDQGWQTTALDQIWSLACFYTTTYKLGILFKFLKDYKCKQRICD